MSRIPAGHPEGYLEAFATFHAEAADAIRAVQAGGDRDTAQALLPGIGDGMAGMGFIAACVASSRADAAWTRL
ncbi:hypothetical protein [Limimaricola cinnabarinus]|uniref:Uncharacterized protein n=1 Tax=Limimaricola cinnabarinus TaxID=1125964 RepID=A0A2G1MET9_9RHOB|nr:hypothetical protein [Limimaricola cinnabarinus]PHP27251.1 hypothetical protein CJ301_12135 [Limimaricola cinnabarinus]